MDRLGNLRILLADNHATARRGMWSGWKIGQVGRSLARRITRSGRYSGAWAMVLKSDATVDLMQAVDAASLEKMYLSWTMAQLLMNERASNQALNRLTERELEILRRLAECKGSREPHRFWA